MKESRAFLWAMIGGAVAALLFPILGAAVQTYVLPTGTTGERTELLTNGPNRDEAQRSSFSGAAIPSVPVPVPGQLWFDNISDQLFINSASGSSWYRIFLGADWTITCATGYTEVRGWCIDTDGSNALLRTNTANETSYVTSTVNAYAKLVIVKSLVYLAQDGTAESAAIASCVLPGDSAETACAANHQVAYATANLANEVTASVSTLVVRANSSGQVKTRCSISGVLSNQFCEWYVVGYIP